MAQVKNNDLKALYGNEKYNLIIIELKQRLSLIITACICASFGFLCLGAYVIKSSQSQIIPYLVTIDTHGVVLARGRIDLDKNISKEAIGSTLASFIKNMRSISSDSKIQRNLILETYAFVKEGSLASHKLDSYFNEENPFIKNKKTTVNVNINNVITQDHNRIQIDWTEEIFNDEALSDSLMYRAILAYEINEEKISDPNDLLLNPLGIFVKDFAVSAVLPN